LASRWRCAELSSAVYKPSFSAETDQSGANTELNVVAAVPGVPAKLQRLYESAD